MGGFNGAVLLFKGDEVDPQDKYLCALTDACYRAFLVPVLQFNFINQDELCNALKNPHKYSGIVLTSPRCVKAVENVWSFKLYSRWNERKIFVVGPSTSNAVHNALYLSTEGEEACSAEALGVLIRKSLGVDEGGKPSPLLYPCSSLADSSNFAGLPVERIVAYETCEHVDLCSVEHLAKERLICVFFSPSGVRAVLNEFKKKSIGKFRSVAIGNTTAQALRQEGCPPDVVCEKPTPAGLVSALRKLCHLGESGGDGPEGPATPTASAGGSESPGTSELLSERPNAEGLAQDSTSYSEDHVNDA